MLNLDTNTFGNNRGVMSKSPAAVNLTDDWDTSHFKNSNWKIQSISIV